MKSATLKKNILELSVAKKFFKARREWFLYRIVITKTWHNCMCGDRIKELCYLKNKLNDNIVRVGNICTRDHMNLNSVPFFNALKEICKNEAPEPNAMQIKNFDFKAFVQRHLPEEDNDRYFYNNRVRRHHQLSKKKTTY